MKIIIYSTDASEEDCRREDFWTEVDGKEYLLAPSALGLNVHIQKEIREKAQALFGQDVEIVHGDRFDR